MPSLFSSVRHSFVCLQAIAHSRLALTPEARDYIAAGHSPEAVVYNAVPAEGAEMPQVQATVEKPVWAVGFKKAMEKGWIKTSKEGGKALLSRKVEAIQDTCLSNLRAVESEAEVADSVAAELKKRKLVKLEQWKTFKISKGPAFALEIVKPETDLTAELLQSGEWQNKKFKEYNFNVRSTEAGTHSHRLLVTLFLLAHPTCGHSARRCCECSGSVSRCAGNGAHASQWSLASTAQSANPVPQDLHGYGLHRDAHE